MITLNKIKNDNASEQSADKKEKMIEFASKYKNLELFKNFDDETTYWCIMLYVLLMYIDYDTQKLWESFADEIKTKNRFFPESELLKKITDIADKATCYISKGEILYRARDYSQKDFLNNEIVISLAKYMKEEFPNLKFDTTDIFNKSVMSIAMIYLYGDQEKCERITDKMDSLLNQEIDFYGYDKSNSDAPPSEYAKEGRANPKGISYLYAAKDVKTAILEMRPQMQKIYNIATVELVKDAKIFDFTYSPAQFKEDEYSIVADLYRISEEFSKPNFGDLAEYVPTQFLCEFIKRMGYDGIKFKSAVSETGINILLFDVNESTRVYDITGSKVYMVKSLDVDISQVLPMTNEEKEQADMLFICYPKCSTCKKAKKWLDEHNVNYTERHIGEANPTYDELKEWYSMSGLSLKKFFNTSGQLYKEMQLKDKLPAMSEEEQLQLLAANGMLVKRPLIVKENIVLVGFKEAEWVGKLN
jgi:arsenate reductase